MVLGLGGESTMKQLPAEASAGLAHVKEAGLYMFPYSKDQNEMAKLMEKNPYGIMVFTPAGPMNMGPLLGVQAISDILACLIAAWLFSIALPSLTSLASRVGFVVALGAFSFMTSEVPYWNWYHFPADFSAFALVFKLTAMLVAGLILAMLMGGRAGSTR